MDFSKGFPGLTGDFQTVASLSTTLKDPGTFVMMGFTIFLIVLTGPSSGEAGTVLVEPRFPGPLAVTDGGRGAESAVRYSESLRSPSPNSSPSSELAVSNPAKRLLKRCGRRIGADLSEESGPLSLFPG
jgi:hypothetical protein